MMKMNSIKNDVKKLLQEHVKTNTVAKEVDSPYAKYNSRGQLMCIVCSIPVKSKIIWQAHVNKRSHKENLSRLKEKQEKISQLQFQKLEKKDAQKRPAPTDNTNCKPSKSSKSEKPRGILKNLDNYSSSEEESENDPGGRRNEGELVEVKQEFPSNQNLPDNFFDDGTRNMFTTQPHNIKLNSTQKDAKSKPSTSDVLPEGFFDDPVADAKARNVEYRDKDADEWESFMKAVSMAEVESQQIIAEDKEEAAIATQLEQTDEQIKCLQRIVELDKAKQSQLSEKKTTCIESGDDDSSDEEFSPVIWRTKNSLI